MTDVLRISPGLDAAAAWFDIARGIARWCAAAGVAIGDTVVLVPAVRHVALLQRALAAAAPAIPVVETAWTLGRSVAPPQPPEPGQVSGDTALDRLVARRLLRRVRAGSSPRAAAHAAAAVTATAQALVAAAAAVDPAQRPARYADWAAQIGAAATRQGAGRRDALLSRVALEWAALAASPATDALFALTPAAWVVVETARAGDGGPPGVERSLLQAADGRRPTLLVDATVDPGAEADIAPPRTRCTLAVCDGFDDEAQRAAAAVIDHVAAGRRPVALVAQDRLVVRRVRALLGRQPIPIQDETGWTLSTTRAAAMLRSLLRAARRGATTDDWLDWLKACPGARTADVGAIESRWRRTRPRVPTSAPTREGGLPPSPVRAVADPDPFGVDAASLGVGADLWRAACAAVAVLEAGRPKPLSAWRRALDRATQALGLQAALAADDAGAQLLAVLQIGPHLGCDLPGAAQGSASGDPGDPGDPVDPVDPGDTVGPIDQAAFLEWAETRMEEAVYLPPVPQAGDGAGPAVVITPLARAALRPFAAVVFPGADGHGLGGGSTPPTLFSDAQCTALGLPDRALMRRRESAALGQLLRQPHIDFLCRRQDGDEPWPPSPLLQSLQLGRPALWAAAGDARTTRHAPPRPVPPPLPSAPHLLPARLSASACDALRSCPYRFHALHVLGLRETDELDAEPDKRDYGTWLHAVLHAFHAGRDPALGPQDDAAALDAAAVAAQAVLALDEADFLPYAASFRRFAPRYLDWLRQHEADGLRWQSGEMALTAQPLGWQGTVMHGRIDRIDRIDRINAAGGPSPALQLIDYKTGSRKRLSDAIRSGEDVQLPFYAALVAAQADGSGDAALAAIAAPGRIDACYLLLDDADGVAELAHADIAASAEALVAGIGTDLARLRAGAAMPALGEGDACAHCAARGLCRRDHWAPS